MLIFALFVVSKLCFLKGYAESRGGGHEIMKFFQIMAI